MRLGVPIQKPELPAHGGVAVLEASSPDRCPDRALRAGLGPVRPDAPVASPISDRLPPFRREIDDAEERVQAFRAFGSWLGDVHELAFVPAMDLPETYKYETIHVLQALLKSLDGSDTVVRARSVAGDRLLPTSKWHLHNWRPGPDDFAFFPEKEHLDVHRLAPAVLVGEL